MPAQTGSIATEYSNLNKEIKIKILNKSSNINYRQLASPHRAADLENNSVRITEWLFVVGQVNKNNVIQLSFSSFT
jgi:hypothetical protein